MAPVSSPVQQLYQHVRTMLNSSDPYPFLSVVEDYLAAVPADDQLRAQAVRLLVDKGLFSVAAELAEACPAASPNAEELHGAAKQMARMQADRIDRKETDDWFAVNLEALRARSPQGKALAETVAEAWRTGGGELTAYRANDGNFQVRAVRSDGRRIWVPAALDFTGQLEILGSTEAWKGNLLAPFLVDGVGLGWLVPRLHAATERTFLTYSAALYIVEPNLRALALVLRLHDWSAVLADERVYVFAGPSAWEQWRELMRQDHALTPPREAITLPPWPGAAASLAEQTHQEVIRQRDEFYAEQRERVERYYQGRDAALWAGRYEAADGADPLRVLCVTCRYTTFLQYSTRDMIAAFERAGMATKLLIEEHDHALLARQTYMKAFAEFKPDLVFVIDHHRHEFPDRYPANVPYVCWIQDELPLLFEPETGRRLGPLDFTIGFGRTKGVLQSRYPAERFMPCKMAVSLDKFSGNHADDTEPDECPSCDVDYVSHHSEPPEALHARVRKMASNKLLEQLMDAFYEETRPLLTSPRFNAAYDLDLLFRAVEAKVGVTCPDAVTRDRMMSVYVRPLVDRTLRHTTLSWVADWVDATGRTFHLYGRGWEQHRRFSRYAQGPARHGRHLARISRGAAINLHTGTSTALHQRVLETVAAGAFLLIRYNPCDFRPPANESLQRYLLEHGIDRPTRIPIDRLPADYVEARRKRLLAAGRPTPDYIEITAEYLLERDSRREEDQRYDFANLAFTDLEQITFDGPETFVQRAEHFMEHAEQRQRITGQMQQAVNELFTYDALVARLIRFIRRQLQAPSQ